MEHAADGTGGENGDEDEMGGGGGSGREGSHSQGIITRAKAQQHASAGRGVVVGDIDLPSDTGQTPPKPNHVSYTPKTQRG